MPESFKKRVTRAYTAGYVAALEDAIRDAPTDGIRLHLTDLLRKVRADGIPPEAPRRERIVVGEIREGDPVRMTADGGVAGPPRSGGVVIHNAYRLGDREVTMTNQQIAEAQRNHIPAIADAIRAIPTERFLR